MSSERKALDELVVPDETTVEEHAIVTDTDVFVGGRTTLDFAVRGANVLAGEGVTIGGDIEAEEDCRIGMWSTVNGSVLVGRDAYLGERTTINGQLVVGRDLDIGDDVSIEEGFEANGWIVIRNPMPLIFFFIAYLSHVFRTGDEEAIQALQDAADAAAEELPTIPNDPSAFIVPRNADIEDDSWEVSTPARIGSKCRLHGNLRARRIEVGEASTVYGSLRADVDIFVGSDTIVHGNVEAPQGTVDLAPGAEILGDVRAGNLLLTPDTIVEGSMRASGTVDISEHRP